VAVTNLDRLFDRAMDEILRFAYGSKRVPAFGEARGYRG
jgi:hypothetical protein